MRLTETFQPRAFAYVGVRSLSSYDALQAEAAPDQER